MECAPQQSKVKRFCFNAVSALHRFLVTDGQTGRGVIKLWGVESQNLCEKLRFVHSIHS